MNTFIHYLNITGKNFINKNSFYIKADVVVAVVALQLCIENVGDEGDKEEVAFKLVDFLEGD